MSPPVYSVGQVWGAADVNTWAIDQSIVKSSAQAVTSSTTLVNDTALVLPVAANATYEFFLYMYYDGGTLGASDLRVALSIPSGTVYALHPSGVNSAGNNLSQAVLIQTGPNWLFGTAGAGNGCSATVQGTIVTSSTSGNLQLQWAQVTSSATATTMHTNSMMRLTRTG